jgi:HlyD family secretion protein
MLRNILIVTCVLVLFAIGFFIIKKATTEKEHALTLYGNVDVRLVDLGFRVEGRVQKMHFDEGDFVPKGVLMAFLEKQPYLDLVRQAEAAVQLAKYQLANAELLVKRREKAIKSNAVSEEDYKNAIASRDEFHAQVNEATAALGVAQKNLWDIELFAPVDGTILTRVREPGTVVRVADPIYTLSVISPVWIRAYVTEPELGLIYPGMKAEIHTDTKGGKVYVGHIGFISPMAEFTPKTVETTSLRTDLVYRLRIVADNPDHLLKQGMPVTVKLPITVQN